MPAASAKQFVGRQLGIIKTPQTLRSSVAQPFRFLRHFYFIFLKKEKGLTQNQKDQPNMLVVPFNESLCRDESSTIRAAANHCRDTFEASNLKMLSVIDRSSTVHGGGVEYCWKF